MNNRLRLASAVYGVVTGLYPRRFRQAFGSEMQAVFTDRALDAALQGGRQFLAVCLNELWDLPGSLLREYRAEHIERKAMMDKRAEAGLDAEPQKPLAGRAAASGTWKDAFLAGLPYVLIALFVLAPVAFNSLGLGLPETFINVTGFAGLGAEAVLLLFAWRRGWPRWSASVYGFVIPMALMIPMIATQQMGGMNAASFENIYTYVVLPFLIAVFFYIIAQRDPVRGMLALLPSMLLLWQPVLEFVPTRVDSWVLIWMMLAAAIVAALIIRLGKTGGGVWFLLGYILVTGLPAAYVRTYLNDLPPEHASPASLGELFYNLVPPLFGCAGMIIGPLLAWSARQVARAGGRAEITGYRLVVAGLFLNLGGNLAAFLLLGIGDLRVFWSIGTDGLIAATNPVIFLGLLLATCGAVLFVLAAYRRGTLENALQALLVVLYPLALPLMVMSPLLFGFRYNPASLPFGLYDLSTPQAVAVYTFGFIWILLGGWLVTRLGRTPPQSRQARLDGAGLALVR